MAVKQILGKVTVTPKGEYSSGETYKRLDIVTSNGQSYIAKVDNTGVSVTDTNTWLQLVEKPEKGIDYFTEEDIAQLVSMVTDDSESEFNEYYNGKVSDFDSNASSKTSEFNSNYDEKVESFNTIFDTSTDNFDGNYETKLSAFNENASTQTSTFNSVVEQATSDFNSNASTLTETFNTNASEKTSAFNINASEKTQEFNDNVDEKTEQITSQLDNYVQFDNYPSNEKAGVVKSHINGFQVSENGNPNAAILSKEQYNTIENQYFISKGTLENIKDDYVGSSTPVKNLNNSLKDFTPKQDAEGTDNTFDDGLESPLYALSGDGASEQVTTTGANLLPYPYSETSITRDGLTFTVNDDGSVTVNGTATVNTGFTLFADISENSTVEIPGDYVSGGSEKVLVRVLNRTNGSYNLIASNKSGFTKIDKSTYTKGYIELQVTAGTTVNNEIIKPMLSNEQDIPYEPYTGGQPSPSPDYEQPINSIEGSLEFACNDNKGSSNQVTFDLGEEKLRSVGDVKDELVVDLDTGDYYKLKNIEHLELAVANMNNISENYPGWRNVEKINDYFPNENATINTLAKFKSNITTNGVTIGINTLEQSNLWLEKGEFNLTQTQWKQQYPDLIFKLDYSIPSTEKIKLGTLSAEDLAKLKTFKGYNNVTVNTNLGLMNIRFTYGLDIKKYVDNKIAELSAQLIKGE